MADAAMQVANIMEAGNRLDQSDRFARIAYQSYADVDRSSRQPANREDIPSSDESIIALWLML